MQCLKYLLFVADAINIISTEKNYMLPALLLHHLSPCSCKVQHKAHTWQPILCTNGYYKTSDCQKTRNELRSVK